jgi:hypothetical protein
MKKIVRICTRPLQYGTKTEVGKLVSTLGLKNDQQPSPLAALAAR